MTTFTAPKRLRAAAAAVLLLTAVVLLAWRGDATALTLLGYLPTIVVGLLTATIDSAFLADPALWRSAGLLVGVVALLYAARQAWPRRHLLGNLSDRRLHRLLVGSVVVAAVIPFGYAVTRIAWALGIPLGLSREFLDSIQDIVNNGLVLGIGAVLGAVLTIGLVRPWGEVFPRWMPWIGGRSVPVGLARNSALVVALAVTSAGCYFVRSTISGSIGIAPEGAEEHWAAWLPEIFWPLWGAALAVAAIAYADRRRRRWLSAEAPRAELRETRRDGSARNQTSNLNVREP